MPKKSLLAFLFFSFINQSAAVGAVATWNFKLHPSLKYKYVEIRAPKFTDEYYAEYIDCETYSTRLGHIKGLETVYLTGDDTATYSCWATNYLDVDYSTYVNMLAIAPMNLLDVYGNYNLYLYFYYDPWGINPHGKDYGANFLLMQSISGEKPLLITQFLTEDF